MSNIVSAIVGIVSKPISAVVEKYIERKSNQDSIKGKARMAKQEGEKNITLTDSEWETVSKNAEDESWKDEAVTLVVLSPMVLILAGSLMIAYNGDGRVLEGTLAGIREMAVLGVDMGELMTIVVLAAVSLKVWRKS